MPGSVLVPVTAPVTIKQSNNRVRKRWVQVLLTTENTRETNAVVLFRFHGHRVRLSQIPLKAHDQRSFRSLIDENKQLLFIQCHISRVKGVGVRIVSVTIGEPVFRKYNSNGEYYCTATCRCFVNFYFFFGVNFYEFWI